MLGAIFISVRSFRLSGYPSLFFLADNVSIWIHFLLMNLPGFWVEMSRHADNDYRVSDKILRLSGNHWASMVFTFQWWFDVESHKYIKKKKNLTNSRIQWKYKFCLPWSLTIGRHPDFILLFIFVLLIHRGWHGLLSLVASSASLVFFPLMPVPCNRASRRNSLISSFTWKYEWGMRLNRLPSLETLHTIRRQKNASAVVDF